MLRSAGFGPCVIGAALWSAASHPSTAAAGGSVPEPQYFLTSEQTHNKFSRSIPAAIRVPSGAVVQVDTQEATDGQLTLESTPQDVTSLDFDPIHPLTGPIYVEGAAPGDVLAVTLHKIDVGTWGWTCIAPGFGFLSDEFTQPWIRTFEIPKGATSIRFDDGIVLPMRPFPGVMGVAPNTDEMLSTIPPRANGGNMDDPHLVAGTTAYFPVFVEGALFSIGDTHAVQGMGEVCGTAVEAPMRIVLELRVLKGGRSIAEPEYETAETYAVTAFATTLDEAGRKATRYMVDYLTHEYGLDRNEAYALCSLAGELRIAEVVDVPHVLVAMHIPKHIFTERGSGD